MVVGCYHIQLKNKPKNQTKNKQTKNKTKTIKDNKQDKKQTKHNKHIQKPKKLQNNGTTFKTRED